jgi:hypothetical protein
MILISCSSKPQDVIEFAAAAPAVRDTIRTGRVLKAANWWISCELKIPDPLFPIKLNAQKRRPGDKVALGQTFSGYFGLPCQSSFHQLLHSHHHLLSGAGTIGSSGHSTKWTHPLRIIIKQNNNVKNNSGGKRILQTVLKLRSTNPEVADIIMYFSPTFLEGVFDTIPPPPGL